MCPDDELLLELLPVGVPELFAVCITWGSPAMAQEAPVTTSSPVASAAAGRSQPIQPPRRRSGPNRSATAPYAYLILMAAGSRCLATTLSAASTPVRYLLLQAASPVYRTDCAGGAATIFVRIRSSPSAAGSIESAASRSARLSVCSSAA